MATLAHGHAIPVEPKPLLVPPLNELSDVLAAGLKRNFLDVSVNVVDCPDLMQPPWHLAAPGLGGSTCLLDIGGVPYLMPIPDRSKFYNLGEMAALSGLPNAFILGAGAASSRVAGVNCEMIPNAKVSTDSCGSSNNCTHIAKVSTEDGSCILETFPSTESGPLANILACEGIPGPVIEIKAKGRTGEDNFVSCMRKAVGERYGEVPVGLGGVFLIAKGKAKLHVMPDFSSTPLNSDKDVKEWLKFYEMSSPLICLSVFISHDPGLDLRVEHTHCFSTHGEGGHYHYDVTPDDVEYHAYYTVAERMVRIDRPKVTHQIGRD